MIFLLFSLIATNNPIDYEISVWIIFITTKGFIDHLPLEKIQDFKKKAIEYFEKNKMKKELKEESTENLLKKWELHAKKLKKQYNA